MNQLPPRVKICCIADQREAELAIALGASALGLVSEMPSGPGVIEESMIALVADAVPPGIATFLLTSKQDVAEIVAQQKRCRAGVIQLVDRLDPDHYQELKLALPGISIVQVIHVTGPESIDEACAAAVFVHGILLDSGNPNLTIKELGGTGRTHNWAISRKIVETVGRPVFLAGGLNPDNIVQAIQEVRPFGIDLCSGVRSNGRLDEEKLRAFMKAVRSTGETF